MQWNPVLCIVTDGIIRHLITLFHWSENFFICVEWNQIWSEILKSFEQELVFIKVSSFWLGCLVSLLTAGQVQLESSYNRSSRTANLGFPFEFSWNYTGDLLKIEWGTKDRNKIDLDVTLFVLGRNGRLIPNISQYNGRRFGSWNEQSRRQVTFTLNPIKEVDNQVFIFRFVPRNSLARSVFDMVQLIVRGKNFCCVINCFITEGSMVFNFNNTERK